MAPEFVAGLAGFAILLETVVSMVLIRRRGGPSMLGIVCNAAAGLALIAAVLLALADAEPLMIVAAFAVGGAAHVGETWARWRAGPGRGPAA